jgi:hypothetical protein
LLNGSGLDPGQGSRRKANAASRAHALAAEASDLRVFVGSVEELAPERRWQQRRFSLREKLGPQ